MAHAHTPTLEQDKLYIGATASRIGIPALIVGIVALGAAAWMGFGTADTKSHFFHSYLAAYSFFLALTLGSLLFVLIQHVVRAGWSVSVRRLAEGMSMNIFLMVILMLPLLAGTAELFPWMHADLFKHDEVLQAKAGYLNPTFFYIRLVAYFVVWCATATVYSMRSAQQDKTGDVRATRLLEIMSPVCTILFGFSLTGFAFDWIMSLDPHWFSTIFGVYYFAGAMLSAFSAIVLLSLLLKKQGLIGDAINHEHYHDLGKFMFAFTFFWGYVAFAQYMLIWYANLPEETQFFSIRQIGPWAALTLFLLFVHVVIPFPGLVSRHVKRSNAVIAFWAVWSLCACAFDIYWLVIPNEWTNKIPAEVGDPHMEMQEAVSKLVASNHDIYHLSAAHQGFAAQMYYPLQAHSVLVTALCFVGVAGLWVFATMINLRGKSLVPLQDPRLHESLAFENA